MGKQEFITNFGDTSFALRVNNLHEAQFSWETQRHCHADYELHMILSGTCSVSVDAHQYTLTAGNAMMITPGHYHFPQAIGNRFRKLSLSFFPFSGNVGEALQNAEAVSIIPLSETVLQLANRILEESNDNLPFQHALTGAMLSHVMVYTLRKLSIPERFTELDLPNAWRTDIIDDFFSENIAYGTEAQLAEQLHLSRRQLTRVMQTHYGMTFRQKLLAARMDRAGWLMRTTDLTIAQVYGNVGYNSEAAFYQNFKDYYGLTPQQYRKKEQEQK